jgi:tRNA (adenine22-N1)-methyltransferase
MNSNQHSNKHSKQLSARLRFLFDSLLPGKPVWDLCCDHGLLGISAYQSQAFSEVVFVDQVEHIIKRLFHRFHQDHRSSDNPTLAEFKIADARFLEGPLLGNLVLAGVGATNSLEILLSLLARGALRAERLLLCPQNHSEMFAAEMQTQFFHRFALSQRQDVQERARTRTIFIYDRIL